MKQVIMITQCINVFLIISETWVVFKNMRNRMLKNSVRIERVAEREGIRLYSELDLEDISKRLTTAGVQASISDIPTHYLCNEAYWFSLQKYKGKAMFIHIPTTNNIDDSFFEKMKEVLG